MGVMLFYGQNGDKGYHHDVTSGYLTTNLMSYGSWASEAEYSGNTFHNFISNTTKCGNRQTLLRRNPDSSDYIPVQKFYNTIFDNVSDEAMVWLEDPDPHWANAADCAGFPCTAPNNVVMTFEGTSFTGSKQPTFREKEFQIVSDTARVSETFKDCEFTEQWNAWQCQQDNLGVLVAIGDDGDAYDRSVVPVYFTNEESGYTNKVNYMMDNTWDGFYASQMHKSMFPTMVQTDRNYTVEYSGTPFGNMRYKLWSKEGAFKVKVLYWNAGSY